MPSLSVELDAVKSDRRTCHRALVRPCIGHRRFIGRVAAVILTMQVSVAVNPPLSVTVSWKVRDVPLVPADGAVKVGLATAAFESVTVVPAVCFQA